MIFHQAKYSLYAPWIILSIWMGMLFNNIFLKKNHIEKRYRLFFILMISLYSIVGGIILNAIIHRTSSIGLTSYGGVIGIILGAFLFGKMEPKNSGIYFKSAILSLPLIYSISKLACFFSGCCYGIPYHGFFSITYTYELNIPLLPIQLIETIVFMLLFFICLWMQKNLYIIEITIILSAIAKGILDFGRYDHLKHVITINQIISIIFVIIGVSIILKRKFKNRRIREYDM